MDDRCSTTGKALENLDRQSGRGQESSASPNGLLLERLNLLIDVSARVLSESTVGGLLQRVVDAARDLTKAGIGTTGHGYSDGTFRIGAASRGEEVPPCPPGEAFTMHWGGVYLEIVERGARVCLTHEQLVTHPQWRGLPEGHAPLRGLLGVPLMGLDGLPNGMIMVSDKAEGEFTADDEALLSQLALLASLALQHIEARESAERRAEDITRLNEELEMRVVDRTAQLEATVAELQQEILHREQAEAEIASLARFPAENPNPVLRVAADGKILYANAAGAPLVDLWQCGSGKALPEDLRGMIGTGLHSGRNTEFEVSCGDVVFSIVLAPVSAAGYVNLYGRDITMHKRAERALKDSEEKYRLVIENAHEGAWAIDGNAVTTFVSRRMAEMMGYTVDEMVGRSLLSFTDEQGMAIARINLESSREGVTRRHDFEFIRKDGARLYTSVSMSPIRGCDDAFAGAFAFVTDISDRQRAEESAAAHAFWESIADTAASGLVITGPDGAITYANDGFCSLIGYTRDELIGARPPYVWMPREYTNGSDTDALWKVPLKSCHMELISQSGARVPVVVNTSEHSAEQGVITARVAGFRNISDLVSMEEQLHRQERLALLGQLAGSIGHEIRNPLGVIQSSAYYLRSKLGNGDDKVKQHFERLENSVAFIEKVISDLLSLARMPRLKKKHLDLAPLVRHIIAGMKIPEGVRVAISGDVAGTVLADQTQMIQIFSNLIGNALDAMPDGGDLDIRFARDAGSVTITVKDTGSGIPEENLDKVFEPLFSTKARGAGFGLTICRRIVEFHGGSIDMKSSTEAGTEVTVILPDERGTGDE